MEKSKQDDQKEYWWETILRNQFNMNEESGRLAYERNSGFITEGR